MQGHGWLLGGVLKRDFSALLLQNVFSEEFHWKVLRGKSMSMNPLRVCRSLVVHFALRLGRTSMCRPSDLCGEVWS